MKVRLRFLGKLLAFSLALFVLWPYISPAYIHVLKRILKAASPLYTVMPEDESLFQKMSIYLVPFIVLVLSTPKITTGRKAEFIALGIFIFFVQDFIFFQYLISIEGDAAVPEQSLADVIYQNVKLLLPFLLWIIMSYPYLGELFKARPANVPLHHVCPLCEENQPDVVSHIREVHGKKSFKIKKVVKFIADNPELS